MCIIRKMENLSQLETLLQNLPIDPTSEIYETSIRRYASSLSRFGLAGIRGIGRWFGSIEISFGPIKVDRSNMAFQPAVVFGQSTQI